MRIHVALGLLAIGCGGGSTTDPSTTSSGTPCDGVLVDHYVDADEDGFGDADAPAVPACTAPSGSVANNLDCDDSDGEVHPDADEVCDAIDNDCSGEADDGLSFADYYPDADLDGFGNGEAEPVHACSPVKGHVTDDSDCNDEVKAINPAATEVCNDIDDDCDDTPDDGLTFVDYFLDADLDGYGDVGGAAISSCVPVAEHVPDNTDCDDSTALVSPEAPERCNLVDDDCDGVVDNGLGTPRVNHALGATATPSTTFAGYSAEKVVDGSRDTSLGGTHSWSSSRGNGTFEIDLGAEVPFGRVDVYTTEGYELADWDLEYWDGSGWVGLATVTDNTDAHHIHTFAEISASRIRLTDLQGPDHQAAYTRLNEIEVYRNQAPDASPSATATAATYSAADTNDGSRGTTLGDGWSNDGTLPDSVQLDFAECRSFDLIELFTTEGAFSMQDYDVEVYDGADWITVAEVRDNTSAQVTSRFDEVAGEQVRVTCLYGSSVQPGYARINEIELY